VKLAEIVLTPEKPHYPGGSWHVEGTVNEQIVATVIAYVESSNITDSKLAFRHAVSSHPDIDELKHTHYHGVESVFGFREGQALNQSAGAVHCSQGRVLCFPNSMQHRVLPFQLADASKPGIRKIAAFFIVDPATRIPSTRTVPPQQLSWWRPLAGLHMKLPRGAVDEVEKHVEFPLSRAAAVKRREELMAERKAVVDDSNDFLYEASFSMCEH
jgi:Protein of unknown function (DUF4246)